MSRIIEIHFEGGTSLVEIPDDAKMTFGPWSPPGMSAKATYGNTPERGGTLRIYRGARTSGDVIGVFANVLGYHDTSLIKPILPMPAAKPAKLKPLIEAPGWGDLTDGEKEDLANRISKILIDKQDEPDPVF